VAAQARFINSRRARAGWDFRLAQHMELEELDLHDSGITDHGLLTLKKLTALKKLDVRGIEVTEQGIAALAQSLPDCEIVR
jgi:Ran GTPase-activating protein (RanGAP) involved in mRNA processing and transport